MAGENRTRDRLAAKHQRRLESWLERQVSLGDQAVGLEIVKRITPLDHQFRERDAAKEIGGPFVAGARVKPRPSTAPASAFAKEAAGGAGHTDAVTDEYVGAGAGLKLLLRTRERELELPGPEYRLEVLRPRTDVERVNQAIESRVGMDLEAAPDHPSTHEFRSASKDRWVSGRPFVATVKPVTAATRSLTGEKVPLGHPGEPYLTRDESEGLLARTRDKDKEMENVLARKKREAEAAARAERERLAEWESTMRSFKEFQRGQERLQKEMEENRSRQQEQQRQGGGIPNGSMIFTDPALLLANPLMSLYDPSGLFGPDKGLEEGDEGGRGNEARSRPVSSRPNSSGRFNQASGRVSQGGGGQGVQPTKPRPLTAPAPRGKVTTLTLPPAPGAARGAKEGGEDTHTYYKTISGMSNEKAKALLKLRHVTKRWGD